jgi:creatinine amidohydrolase/Fe(II)-dependent formamide hydrolase-like protein
MQKVDLDAMTIEELAKLCDNASLKLADKVAARRKELEAELERLAVYGKPRKAAPPVAPKLVKDAAKELVKDSKEAAKAA